MGNVLSCDSGAKRAADDTVDAARPVDFSQKPHGPSPSQSSQNGINIFAPRSILASDEPPPYTEQDTRWSQIFLSAVKLAHEQGLLRSLPSRHVYLYIDDNFRVGRQTKDAIKLFACCLVLIFRSLDVDATIFFTNHRNTRKLPQEIRSREEYLDGLFVRNDWYEAQRYVDNFPTYSRHFGLKDWMTANENTPEKFLKLLAHVREMKLQAWEGWHARGMESDALLAHTKEAFSKSKQQPRLLNSLAFTLRQAICKIKSLESSELTAPTSVLVLTASELQRSEVDAIKSEMRDVVGRAKEFSIQVAAFIDKPNDISLRAHRALDDFRSGDRDIYDVTTVAVKRFLEQGLTAELLGKVLGSHDKRRVVRDESGLYGRATLGLHDINLPSLREVKTAVGVDDDE